MKSVRPRRRVFFKCAFHLGFGLGKTWVLSDLADSINWQFEEPTSNPDGIHYVRAVTTATITLPASSTPTALQIPWLFRLDQDARTAVTRQKKELKLHRQAIGVTSSPQWQEAAITPPDLAPQPSRRTSRN